MSLPAVAAERTSSSPSRYAATAASRTCWTRYRIRTAGSTRWSASPSIASPDAPTTAWPSSMPWNARVPLLAADEPGGTTDPRGTRATRVLTRRVKQGIAEWYVLDMLEKSRAGFEEHTRQGFNIGAAPYGYEADRVPHPVPARKAEGKAKTRLVPDPVTAPVVAQIFTWRVGQRLSYTAIAAQLNTSLSRYPPPMPTRPARAVGHWTAGTVRGILINPKYTGYMVWNRRATRSGGKVNAVEELVCSPKPTHAPIISVETFTAAGEVGRWRRGSRPGAEPNRHPAAHRT